MSEQARQNVYYKGRFTHIARVELSSDGGVDFFLDTPYQNLALLLDIPIVKASEVTVDNPLEPAPTLWKTASAASTCSGW